MTFTTEIGKSGFFSFVFWNKHEDNILMSYVNVDCEHRRATAVLKADYSLQANNLLWQVGIILLV